MTKAQRQQLAAAVEAKDVAAAKQILAVRFWGADGAAKLKKWEGEGRLLEIAERVAREG